MITAKIIKHSVSNCSPFYEELISIQTHAPKFLDAEVEKHRMISSNSSSDRAVPVLTMLERDLFIPDDLRKTQAGMQGYENVDESDKNEYISDLFFAIEKVKNVNRKWAEVVHKQHLNRNIMGWSYQSKIMTATRDQWDAFLKLRLHPAADPAIYKLAVEINDAIHKSIPQKLDEHMWHLPYVDGVASDEYDDFQDLVKASVARCARVSYLTHDKKEPVLADDIKLYDMLLKMNHFSCFEHQSKPMFFTSGKTWKDEEGVTHLTRGCEVYSANFRNFIQYRKLVD